MEAAIVREFRAPLGIEDVPQPKLAENGVFCWALLDLAAAISTSISACPNLIREPSEHPSDGPSYSPLAKALRFRLDVSLYYVIRTIIILNGKRGMGSSNSWAFNKSLAHWLHEQEQSWNKLESGRHSRRLTVGAGRNGPIQ